MAFPVDASLEIYLSKLEVFLLITKKKFDEGETNIIEAPDKADIL